MRGREKTSRGARDEWNKNGGDESGEGQVREERINNNKQGSRDTTAGSQREDRASAYSPWKNLAISLFQRATSASPSSIIGRSVLHKGVSGAIHVYNTWPRLPISAQILHKLIHPPHTLHQILNPLSLPLFIHGLDGIINGFAENR